MRLSDYIKLYPNTYSINECKKLLDNLAKKEWTKHSWYNPDFGKHTKESDPFVVDYHDFPLNPVMNKIGEYVKDLVVYPPIVRQLTYPRANQYRQGCEMAIHNDHIHNIFDNDSGIPTLSIIIMLDEDYEGGELVYEFKDGDLSFKLRSGDVIIWPSLFMYPHRVNKVTNGVRTSIVTWAY